MSERPLDLALGHYRAGRLEDARALYRIAHAADPNDAAILHILGIVECQLGDLKEGVALLSRAVAAAPQAADYQCNLGSALAKSNQPEKAVSAYKTALELNPNYPEAYANLADALCETGKFEEAVAAARRALALRPNYAAAHNNLGRALRALGLLDDAIACLSRATELQPDGALIFANLADALLARARSSLAIPAARRAVQLQPQFLRASILLGQALALNGDLDESISVLRKIARENNDDAEVQNSLGNAFQAAGDIHAAIDAFTRAVKLQPGNSSIHSNLVYALHFDPNADADLIRRKHAEWNDRHAAPLRALRRWHDADRNPDRRLRIGLVSPDFCKHVVGRNILPLVRHRNADQFEVFCYSNTIRPDSMTEQFQAYADGWRDIAGVSDENVAESIRHDRIDILVDLALHMRGNRILLFAYKPAPVQMTFAGYPGGTGLETMDYRLTDPHLDPPGESDSFYREKSIRLPDSFWCYDFDAMELMETGEPSPLPAQSIGSITFGCLNNFVKTNEETFELWGKVLAVVGDSRLILMSPAGEHRQRLIEKLRVDASRVEFVQPQPRGKYLEIYHRIDIGLDTFPYNGHTTSLDASWMGVPIVTLRGQTAVSRAGYSQSKNLGLAGDLVADSPEQFVKNAAALAADLGTLSALRGSLRDRMRKSPLMDAKRFTRNFESALRQIWRDSTPR